MTLRDIDADDPELDAKVRQQNARTVSGPWALGAGDDEDEDEDEDEYLALSGDAIETADPTLSGHRGRQVWQLTRAALNWRAPGREPLTDVLFGRRWLRRGRWTAWRRMAD